MVNVKSNIFLYSYSRSNFFKRRNVTKFIAMAFLFWGQAVGLRQEVIGCGLDVEENNLDPRSEVADVETNHIAAGIVPFN